MTQIGPLLLVLGWAIALTSAILHGVLLPWWKTDLGRHFFGWPVVMTLVLTPNLVRFVLGDFSWRPIFQMVTFALVVLGMGHSLFLLVKYYRKETGRGRKNRVAGD